MSAFYGWQVVKVSFVLTHLSEDNFFAFVKANNDIKRRLPFITIGQSISFKYCPQRTRNRNIAVIYFDT